MITQCAAQFEEWGKYLSDQAFPGGIVYMSTPTQYGKSYWQRQFIGDWNIKKEKEMTQKDFKIGDDVELIEPYMGNAIGTRGKVTGYYAVDLLEVDLANGKSITAYCSRFKLIKKEKTMTDLTTLEKGDVLVRENYYCKYEIIVQGVIGDVLVVIDEDGDAQVYSEKELKGYELKKEEEIKEVTIEEVAEALGVDSKNIRIKE